MMLRPLAVVMGLVCALTAAAPRAAAQAADETQRHVDEGARLFKAGDHDAAFLEFSRAYVQSNDPQLLYLIGRCHEERGRWQEALGAYEDFVAADVPLEARARAEGAMRLLRERLATGRLFVNVSPFGAEVLLDGVPLGVAPVAPQTVTPGKHVVGARLGDGPAETREVEVPAGGEATVAFALAAAPAPAPSAAPAAPASDPAPVVRAEAPAGRSYDPWQWVTLGTGLGLAAVGGTLVGLRVRDEEDYRAGDFDGYEAGVRLKDRSRDEKAAGYALLGIGGAALVAATVLFILDDGRPGAQRVADGTTVALWPVTEGLVFGLEGGF